MSLPLREPPKQKPIKVRTKLRRTTAIRCRPHVNWVLENWRCILIGKVCKSTGVVHQCWGPKDPHHSPTRGAGGGDDGVSPICRGGHSLLDSPNWSEKRVEDEYGVSFRETGADLWSASPPAKRYRLANPAVAKGDRNGEGIAAADGCTASQDKPTTRYSAPTQTKVLEP